MKKLNTEEERVVTKLLNWRINLLENEVDPKRDKTLNELILNSKEHETARKKRFKKHRESIKTYKSALKKIKATL